MGISKVVAIPSTVILGSFFALRNSAPVPLLILMLHASVVGLTAAAAAHRFVNFTALFAKSTEGYFPWWSYLLFHPYLLGLRAYVLLRRSRNKEAVYNEISDGLFVGGWPAKPSDLPPGNPAVVDCTCELPRPGFSDKLPYLCIPTWDSRGPRPEDIELAVRWAINKLDQGRPVYIHCAFGHGRSVSVMCALLVALGQTQTWREGENVIKGVRPRARLNNGQREALQKWSKFCNAMKSSRKLICKPKNKNMRMQVEDLCVDYY